MSRVATAGTTTYGTDNQDRLLSASGSSGAQSWTYDANGDLLTRTDSSGTTAFDYDTLGQLNKVTKPGGQIVSYELDAGNKRAVKRVNGIVQRKWLYAGGLLPVAEYDSNNNLLAVFNGGYMVKNGNTYRILRDHLGSVRLVVDVGTGAVAQRLSYGPWGEVTEDTNPGFQPFGYAGGLYDPDTGLVRFGARDYDPSVGRWTCKDPTGMAASSNTYEYCGDDPINSVDESGTVVVIRGSFASSLVTHLSNLTGYSLNYDSATGTLSINDSVPRRTNGTSKTAADRLKQAIDCAKILTFYAVNNGGFAVGNYMGPDYVPGKVFGDMWHTLIGASSRIDVGDLDAISKIDPAISGQFLAHELDELYTEAQNGTPNPGGGPADQKRWSDEAHKPALQFEATVGGELGRSNPARIDDGVIEATGTQYVQFTNQTVFFPAAGTPYVR